MLSFPAPTLLLVPPINPFLMSAPWGVDGISVLLCMTAHNNVSIVQFKKSTRIRKSINKELKF